MVVRSKITPKRQVTLPAKFLRSLGLHPGDTIIFKMIGQRVEVAGLRKMSLKDFAAKYPPSKIKLTSQQLHDARESIADRWGQR